MVPHRNPYAGLKFNFDQGFNLYALMQHLATGQQTPSPQMDLTCRGGLWGPNHGNTVFTVQLTSFRPSTAFKRAFSFHGIVALERKFAVNHGLHSNALNFPLAMGGIYYPPDGNIYSFNQSWMECRKERQVFSSEGDIANLPLQDFPFSNRLRLKFEAKGLGRVGDLLRLTYQEAWDTIIEGKKGGAEHVCMWELYHVLGLYSLRLRPSLQDPYTALRSLDVNYNWKPLSRKSWRMVQKVYQISHKTTVATITQLSEGLIKDIFGLNQTQMNAVQAEARYWGVSFPK